MLMHVLSSLFYNDVVVGIENIPTGKMLMT